MPKSPAYQWYPGDARRDTALQSCSFYARALWREMMDLMHDGEPYGHLTAGGVPITPAQLARIVGMPLPKIKTWMGELEERKVFSRTDSGVIYSRRMVRDEATRAARAAGGSKSLDHPNVPRPKHERINGRISLPPSSNGSFGGSPAARQQQMQCSSVLPEESSLIAAAAFAHTYENGGSSSKAIDLDGADQRRAIEQMAADLSTTLELVPEERRNAFRASAGGIIRGDTSGTWRDPRGDGGAVPWSERPPLFRLGLDKCVTEQQYGSGALDSAMRYTIPRQLKPFEPPKQRDRIGIDSDKPDAAADPDAPKKKVESIPCPACSLPGGSRISTPQPDGSWSIEERECGNCPASRKAKLKAVK